MRRVRPLEAGANTSSSASRPLLRLSPLLLRGCVRHTSGHTRTQHGLVWYYCGLDKPPSRDTVDRFLTDLEHVIDDVFDRLVEQAAAAACSTPRTLSIRHTSKRFNTTTRRRGTMIQQPRSTTTASAVRSSQPAQKSRLRRSSHRLNKQTRRRRARHV